jgi:hypothetical protein
MLSLVTDMLSLVSCKLGFPFWLPSISKFPSFPGAWALRLERKGTHHHRAALNLKRRLGEFQKRSLICEEAKTGCMRGEIIGCVSFLRSDFELRNFRALPTEPI